ncbi:hypothetical protein R80B4_03100 [Fibrobacteres bacterium R8-0-B4]
MRFIRLHGRALLIAAAVIAVTLGCMITSEEADAETWGAWTVTTPATCYAAGVETRTSTQNASHSETRSIPKLTGSACDAATGGNNTDTETWSSWVTTTPATCSAPGAETRISNQNANRSETRTIPRLTGAACETSEPPATPPVQYESVTAGGKTWMKYNLNIATENSRCYGDNGANCDKYGRLYTWEAARTACPAGWRLPSRQEWQSLVDAAGGDAAGGVKLKTTGGWYDNGNGTDALGFSALPGGYLNASGAFTGGGNVANWWTDTEYNDVQAWYRGVFSDGGGAIEAARNKNSGHSVRCVQSDAPPVNPPVTPTPTTYPVTVASAGTGATGGGNYAAGAAVGIYAGAAPNGQTFKGWTAAGATLPNPNSALTTFTMPANAVTVTAVFEAQTPVTPAVYAVTVVSAGTGSSGGGNYTAGTTVTISAGTAPNGQIFKNWTAAGVTLSNPNSASTTFIMPANAVTVTANFETTTGGDNCTWGAWAVTTPATCTAPGVETRTCTQDASRKETRTIPQLTGADCNTGGGGNIAGGTNCTSAATCKTVQIGSQVWMAENLNISTADSWCYGGVGLSGGDGGIKTLTTSEVQANCAKYGRLYTWNAARTACPNGWKLPDTADWNRLVETAGGQRTAGKKLKQSSGWNNFSTNNGNGTDDYGFSALPGGVTIVSEGISINANAGYAGYWWTATESWAPSVLGDGRAYRQTMTYVSDNVSGNGSSDYAGESNGLSVRCIQGAAAPPPGNNNCTGAATCRSAAMPDGKVWMTENLNVATAESWCYGEGGQVDGGTTLTSSEIQANCKKYGRLYSWAAAKTACPAGWHLPTRDEWGALAIAAGGTGAYGNGGTAGTKLQTTTGWSVNRGTDDYGFSALPGGYRNYSGGTFGAAVYTGLWWTATEITDGSAYYRKIDYYNDYISEADYGKSSAISVRCVGN